VPCPVPGESGSNYALAINNMATIGYVLHRTIPPNMAVTSIMKDQRDAATQHYNAAPSSSHNCMNLNASTQSNTHINYTAHISIVSGLITKALGDSILNIF
jgi:hypothetical protein